MQVADWTLFTCDGEPYDPELYDTVITYDCQDLIDVAAYLYMRHEGCAA
jgi:hypothetical protein